jgi:hypothetical protein
MSFMPIEIQQMIFEGLTSRDDLKSIRSLSQHGREFITPRLFRRINVRTRIESIDRLKSICTSHLARHVQHIHYNLFDIPLVYEIDWNAGLDLLFRTGLIDSKEEFYNEYATYEEYRRYHDNQSLSGEFMLWEDAFCRLPSLTSIEISEYTPYKQREDSVMCKIQAVLADLPGIHIAERPGGVSDAEPDQKWARLHHILKAVLVMSGRLTSLYLTGFRSSWTKMDSGLPWSRQIEVASVFRGLRVFGMNLATGYWAEDARLAGLVQEVVIRHAQHLEQLDISVPPPTDMPIPDSVNEGLHISEDKTCNDTRIFGMLVRRPPIGRVTLIRASADSTLLQDLFENLEYNFSEQKLEFVQLSSQSWTSRWQTTMNARHTRSSKCVATSDSQSS